MLLPARGQSSSITPADSRSFFPRCFVTTEYKYARIYLHYLPVSLFYGVLSAVLITNFFPSAH